MHEISLVRNILNTIEEEFPGKIEQVNTIYLTVGLLANVQPILMQNALAAVQEDNSRYSHIALEIEVLPIKILCPECQTISVVEKYKFICNQCLKPSNNLIQGEEMLITKVSFEN